MPDLIIQFPRADYPSLQIGDVAYYATMDSTETENDDGTTTITVNSVGGFNINNPDEEMTAMGKVKVIDHTTSLEDGTLTTSITVNIGASVTEPTTSDFVFFRKSPRVNLSSILGYYGSAKFINTSTSEAELFSVSCEISESSK
tara:strand:+ start:8746 stop:9177 length:432 start_codon:yes stop_codon:yes gene_type:complete